MLVTVVQILVENWRELRSLRITDQAALLFLQRHLPPKIGDRMSELIHCDTIHEFQQIPIPPYTSQQLLS
ncbi:hypothetical protein YC2023_122866 [Brassica napus]